MACYFLISYVTPLTNRHFWKLHMTILHTCIISVLVLTAGLFTSASGVAVSGDVIEIAAGTYLPEEPVTLYGQDVDIRGAIDAQGAPATILDGQDKGQVLPSCFPNGTNASDATRK
jgi:hypothetical protein